MAEKLTKKQKREASRLERKQKTEQFIKQKKMRKVKTFLWISGVAVTAGAIVASAVIFAPKPVEQLNPVNMLNDAVTLVGGEVLETPAVPKEGKPTPIELRDDRVEVEIYLDYLCPYCKQFDEKQAPIIEKYMNNKDVLFSFHPMAFLGEYSMVATNASACIAGKQPNLWWKTNELLYDAQPEEKDAQGFSLSKSIKHVKDALKSLSLTDETSKCVNDLPYAQWAADSTNRALQEKIPNSNLERISGTPTVLIDGVQIQLDFTSDTQNFDIAIQNALANLKKS